jgi:hypothetical protein
MLADKELNFMKQSSLQTSQQIHQWLPLQNPPSQFSIGCVRISKRSSTSKTLDLRGNKQRKLIKVIFHGFGFFKTLITSRKVSIYCGITFLEVVLKKKRN